MTSSLLVRWWADLAINWKTLERGEDVYSWNHWNVFWLVNFNEMRLPTLVGHCLVRGITRLEQQDKWTRSSKIYHHDCHPPCVLEPQNLPWHPWAFIIQILKGILSRPGRRNQMTSPPQSASARSWPPPGIWDFVFTVLTFLMCYYSSPIYFSSFLQLCPRRVCQDNYALFNNALSLCPER